MSSRSPLCLSKRLVICARTIHTKSLSTRSTTLHAQRNPTTKSPHSTLKCNNQWIWRSSYGNLLSQCSRSYCSGATVYHPRRAVMYVPASDERKTKKAASLSVDTLVFDLEDGVAVNQKENARRMVRNAIADSRLAGQAGSKAEHVVRVNGIESGLVQSDLEAVFVGSHDTESGGGLPDAIMLPKCDTAEQLAELDLALSYHNYGGPSPIQLYIIVESPIGMLNLRDVCQFGTQTAQHLKLCAVVFGSDDFLAMIGGTRTKSASELLYARQSLVTHAKAFGLDAIDLVDIDYKDLAHLKEQAEEGARMGYTGKQVIHPDQVPVVQEAFSPSVAQTKWATELIEAFHQHQQTGKGAFVFQGHMIDKPLLLQAENIVKLQQAISDTT